MHTLILCPLKIEMQALVEALQNKGLECIHKNELNRAVVYIPEKSWIISVGGHGKVAYALSCVKCISYFKNIQSIWCVGSAGALSQDIKLGNVVVSSKTIEHDFKSAVFKKPPEYPATEKNWDEILLKISDFPNIKLGPVASGDEDVITTQRAEELYMQTGALAVAWEGAGGARACVESGLGFLEVRSITDGANEDTFKDFKVHLKKAMESLAKALIAIG